MSGSGMEDDMRAGLGGYSNTIEYIAYSNVAKQPLGISPLSADARPLSQIEVAQATAVGTVAALRASGLVKY